MPDNKNDRGKQDRARVAAEQDYEVDDFARAHGLDRDQARQLIATHGNSRAALEQAVRALRAQ